MAWVEGYSKACTIVKDLAVLLTTAEKDTNGNVVPANNWSLAYPATIDNVADVVILKTTTTPVNNKSLTMYLKIERPNPTTNFQYIQLSLCDTYTTGDSFPTTGANISPMAQWYWYDNTPSAVTASTIGVNLAIHYYGSVNNNRFALILEGDSTINYTEYRISFGYCGRILSFKEGIDDVDGNFALTVRTEGTITKSTTYGTNTADCMDDICMLKTFSGVPYQQHYPAFITPVSTLEKAPDGFNASEWTSKYHLSPIYVVHGRDGYRGYFDGVLAVDKQNIVHRDELVVTNADLTEDRYKFFNVTDSNSFLQNSANGNYGLAIIKK